MDFFRSINSGRFIAIESSNQPANIIIKSSHVLAYQFNWNWTQLVSRCNIKKVEVEVSAWSAGEGKKETKGNHLTLVLQIEECPCYEALHSCSSRTVLLAGRAMYKSCLADMREPTRCTRRIGLCSRRSASLLDMTIIESSSRQSQKLRQDCMERDNGRCVACGFIDPKTFLTLPPNARRGRTSRACRAGISVPCPKDDDDDGNELLSAPTTAANIDGSKNDDDDDDDEHRSTVVKVERKLPGDGNDPFVRLSPDDDDASSGNEGRGVSSGIETDGKGFPLSTVIDLIISCGLVQYEFYKDVTNDRGWMRALVCAMGKEGCLQVTQEGWNKVFDGIFRDWPGGKNAGNLGDIPHPDDGEPGPRWCRDCWLEPEETMCESYKKKGLGIEEKRIKPCLQSHHLIPSVQAPLDHAHERKRLGPFELHDLPDKKPLLGGFQHAPDWEQHTARRRALAAICSKGLIFTLTIGDIKATAGLESSSNSGAVEWETFRLCPPATFTSIG
ncbi:hypothetical protein V8F06_003443 [Rhypophila decipiens]